MTVSTTLRDRIRGLSERSPTIDGYGERACGCTWDSGPFDVPCDRHDREQIEEDAAAAMYAAARRVIGDPSHEAVDALSSALDDFDLLRDGSNDGP